MFGITIKSFKMGSGFFNAWLVHYLEGFVEDIFFILSPQSNISREAQTMILVDHPNVLKSHCSFVSDHNLWVVMPFMSGGSCLHILKAAYPDGFEEVVIATILREVLKGLDYLHHHGHIHRDVKVSICFLIISWRLSKWRFACASVACRL